MSEKLFDRNAVSFCRSWCWCVPEFANVMRRLDKGNVPEDEGYKLINVSSGKYVYRGKEDGFDFACKVQDGKKPLRYIFRASLPLREVRNYRILAAAGVPVPRVLGVGEIRKNLVLKKSFLITEFLDSTYDGRIFMPGGAWRNGFADLRKVYCIKHLQLLAKLHENGYFHKAFHPRNLLFRGENPESMEVFWIDVARMRRAGDLRRAVIVDLHTFFRDMLLEQAETRELVEIYLAAFSQQIFSGCDELMRELVNFKRRCFSRKKYRVFEA